MWSDVWITILFPDVCILFTDQCVVLNAQTHNLDSVDCKADSGCPTTLYFPSMLWNCKLVSKFLCISLLECYLDKLMRSFMIDSMFNHCLYILSNINLKVYVYIRLNGNTKDLKSQVSLHA